MSGGEAKADTASHVTSGIVAKREVGASALASTSDFLVVAILFLDLALVGKIEILNYT